VKYILIYWIIGGIHSRPVVSAPVIFNGRMACEQAKDILQRRAKKYNFRFEGDCVSEFVSGRYKGQ